MSMRPNEFAFLSNLIKSRSGIDLHEDKLYLFESRLLPIASKSGHRDLSSFVSLLMTNRPDETLVQQIIEAMTTNESMFFRDAKPFQYLKDIAFTTLKQQGLTRPLSIWCAACSSGQEPYSIAMMVDENRSHLTSMGAKILATDIDQQILKKAQEGIYNQFEVQRGLPMQMLLKYFKQLPENRWQIDTSLKQMIQFKQHNLLQSARHHGNFDIIFCRNVLIYFDAPTKLQVLQHIADTMNQGGYLFLGSAESVPSAITSLKQHPEHRQLYVKQ